MSDKMKVREGNDGYCYPYTSDDLVVGADGKSVKRRIDEVESEAKENQITLVEDDTSMEGISDTDHDTLTTTNKKIIPAINELNSQCKDIAKKVENVGQPTQEQINTAIDKAIEDGKITGSGGINSTAKTLLETILRNAVYTADQSANITSLVSALSSSDTPATTHFTITNTLTKCTNNNINTSVAKNTSYITTIIPNTGYELNTVTVTMSGVDVTSTVYNNGKININSVTGNIIITAIATKKTGGELNTNGLTAYFDFKTVTEGTLSDGRISILPTQGNGCLFSWGHIAEQNNYGAILGGNVEYSGNGTSTATNCGESFTWVFKCYMKEALSPLFSLNYAKPSNVNKLTFNAIYNNTGGTTTLCSPQGVGGDRKTGYDTFILTVDKNECKLYNGENLLTTVKVNSLTDFVSWYDKLSLGILGGKENGYVSQVAIYDRVLSNVEIVEICEYLKTLEVIA